VHGGFVHFTKLLQYHIQEFNLLICIVYILFIYKYVHEINQNNFLFWTKILWRHFWIDFNKLSPKHSALSIFWLSICSLCLYHWHSGTLWFSLFLLKLNIFPCFASIVTFCMQNNLILTYLHIEKNGLHQNVQKTSKLGDSA
jgi:hypothetical protein